MRESLRRAEARLAALEGGLLVLLLAVMVSLAFAQVVLRQLGRGLLWGETLLRHLVLWTGFLGAALAASEEKHFAWEAAHMRAAPALRPWMRLVSAAAGAAVCGLLASASWTYASDSRAAGEVLFAVGRWSVPAWIAWSGIPGGFLLIVAHQLFKAADAALDASAARGAR